MTEGQLRLAHRALAAPFEPSGLEPLYSFRSSDARAMAPNAVERVVLRLLPTAYRVPAGHALRLSIAGADIGSFLMPPIGRPFSYDVHRDPTHPSRLSLPIYPSSVR